MASPPKCLTPGTSVFRSSKGDYRVASSAESSLPRCTFARPKLLQKSSVERSKIKEIGGVRVLVALTMIWLCQRVVHRWLGRRLSPA